MTARTIGGVAPSPEAAMHILYKHCDTQTDLLRTAAEEVVCGAAAPLRLRVLYALVSLTGKWNALQLRVLQSRRQVPANHAC